MGFGRSRFAVSAVSVVLASALAACAFDGSTSSGSSNVEPGGDGGGGGGDTGPRPSEDGGSPNPSDPSDASDAGTASDAASSNPASPDAGTDSTAPAPAPTPPDGKRVIAYFVSWGVYARNYHVPDVPADRLTDLNYAFANVVNGECVLGDAYADTDKAYPGDSWDPGAKRGSFHQLALSKAKYPKLRTLISVGGWTWSGGFPDAARTAAARAKFVSSCVTFAKTWGFDGIDLDWEYPGGGGLDAGAPEDATNFTLLLAAMRAGLDEWGKQDGKHHPLTIAAPTDPVKVARLEVAKIAALVDSINVMTYDFHGAWDAKTGHNSPLFASAGDPAPTFNTDAGLAAWLSRGAPAAKLVVGAGFYGRGWAGVASTNDGLFQSATGPSAGTWENGVLDYKDIAANYLPTFARHWDASAKVPFLYDPSKKVWISYDDAESLGLRAKYAKEHALGGVMAWELSGDDAKHALLDALVNGLK
jgi:chitinase